MKYFKITNTKEIHFGFAYKTGLNIDSVPFQSNGSCCAGGLYFTTIDHIEEFYSFGCHLREVYLPTDHIDFRIVVDGNKFRANMIILGARYSLFDKSTYKKFHLKMSRNKFLPKLASEAGLPNVLRCLKKSIKFKRCADGAIDIASANGHTDVLDWWLTSKFQLAYSIDSVDLASQNGHVNVLDWWVRSGLELKYTEKAMCTAHLKVLEWWMRSGTDSSIRLKLKYSEYAVIHATRYGHIDILKWWVAFVPSVDMRKTYQSDVNPDGVHDPKVVFACVIDDASAYGHTNVLNWWVESGLEFAYSANAIDLASQNGHLNVLEWWNISKLKLIYTTEAINSASRNRHINVLDWWTTSGLELKYTSNAIDSASTNNHTDVLNWWCRSKLILLYTNLAIDRASGWGIIRILNWWVKSGLELKYTSNAVDSASACGHIGVLNWWVKSGLEFKYTKFAITDATGNDFVHIVKWWEQFEADSHKRFSFLEGGEQSKENDCLSQIKTNMNQLTMSALPANITTQTSSITLSSRINKND